MLKYTTIANDNDTYRLSALLTNGKYHDVSLVHLMDGDELFCWDAEEWLLENLIPILNGKKTTEEADAEIKKFIPVEDFKELKEIFEESISIGFFDNLIKNSPLFKNK